MNEVPTVVAKQWKTDKGESIIPALNVVLGNKVIISDIWVYQDRMMKVGVAPVIDFDAPVPANDPDGVVIIGAIVVAYAQTAGEAQKDSRLLGTDIAYIDAKRVLATSFKRPGSNEEDTAKSRQLAALVDQGKLPQSGKGKITVDGTDYLVATVDMPRSSTNQRRMPKSLYEPARSETTIASQCSRSAVPCGVARSAVA